MQGQGPVPLAPPDRQPPNLKVPEPMKKAGYAIVGLGQLALEEVMPAFGEAKMSRPAALVSGHPDKAKQVAQVYEVAPKAIYSYETYDRLKDDANVDIVYIILPNSMHAEYTIRALEAGKHVLCEKPMATSSAECEKMIAAAKAANRKLIVAYRLHYEPFNRKAAEMAQKREVGPLRTIAMSNTQVTQAPNIRLSATLGGGPVEDIGIYCINAGRYLTGEEPASVTAAAQQPKDNPNFREVPESVSFTLRYPSGVIAHCDCSFNSPDSRRYRVHCGEGFIDLDPAFSYRGLRMRVKRGTPDSGDQRSEELLLREVNQFAEEMDYVSDCVLNHKENRTPGEMGLADLRIIEAIREAIRSGGSVQVRS